MNWKPGLLAFFLALFLLGCSKPEYTYRVTWKNDAGEKLTTLVQGNTFRYEGDRVITYCISDGSLGATGSFPADAEIYMIGTPQSEAQE